MKKIIGWILLTAPFSVIFGIAIYHIGLEAGIVIGGCVLFFGSVYAGVHLLSED